jgi:hypothetical protein
MFVFKTSGETIKSVVRNQKHAFLNIPKNWYPGEIALISKNKKDCGYKEKQIKFIGLLDNFRLLEPGEAEKLWPGNEGRWRYLVEFKEMKELIEPFDLQDVIGKHQCYDQYRGVVCYKRLPSKDETMITEFINKIGTF